MAETFATIDYTVWALFALEYIARFSFAPQRGYFFRTHLLDTFSSSQFRSSGLCGWTTRAPPSPISCGHSDGRKAWATMTFCRFP